MRKRGFPQPFHAELNQKGGLVDGASLLQLVVLDVVEIVCL